MNRVYYGEYSLKHWIDLILKENIVLPDYQRIFVWKEEDVKNLIDTFKKRQFVPPITVGAFKNEGSNLNLLLDGQQRLTSVLLAYLGLYPDKATYIGTIDRFASENDEETEEEDSIQLDNILKWTFKSLTKKGKNKQEILKNINERKYKKLGWEIDEEFIKTTFLGFSYLVPHTPDAKEQQKYYSSVFRNINIQGKELDPQESRAALYFLDKNLVEFFDPSFCKSIIIKNNATKLDFVRYLSLLSQYKKDGNTNRVARGYKSEMEKYYEQYIYEVVGENPSSMFVDFLNIFPDKAYKLQFERLDQAIIALEIPKEEFTSIIDLDMYFFGLINSIVFENKIINVNNKENLKQELVDKINEFRTDTSHLKAPSALKYLKYRIDTSIEIYRKYTNE